MGRVSDWHIELQSHPQYELGWEARMRGEPKASGGVLLGTDATAWGCGWDDAVHDLIPRPEEP